MILGISIENLWLKRLLYFTGMIGGSLAIEFAFKWVHGIFVRVYFQPQGACDRKMSDGGGVLLLRHDEPCAKL